jgi:hypothetical protein
MKTDRMIIVSFVLLAIGVIWLATHWNGTVGFSAAYPFAGSTFQFMITNKGASAFFGVMFTALGIVTLFLAFVQAVLNVVSTRTR